MIIPALRLVLARISKHTRDIVQHAQIQQRITEPEDSTRNDAGPETRLPVACECEPDERDGKEPDCHERSEESSFGPVVAAL